MNVPILRALMQLFAIIANVTKEGLSKEARTIVESYLVLQFNQDLVQEYLELFDKYVDMYHRHESADSMRNKHELTLNSVKVLTICQQINEGLELKEKIVVFLRLLEFINEDQNVTETETEFMTIVATAFNIQPSELLQAHSFILDNAETIEDKTKILIVNSEDIAEHTDINESGAWFGRNKPTTIVEYRHIQLENLEGRIVFLHISSTNLIVFRYFGCTNLYLNGHNILPNRCYVMEPGSIIKGPKVSPLYYSDIASKFLLTSTKAKIVLTAEKAEYRFSNDIVGIQPVTFSEESGQLIGIMGGSGVGKSTILNLLNGKLKPHSGRILINGYDLQADSDKLEGIIGFVPQDDLLIEELTVFQNLYYNARLCFSNLADDLIVLKVDKMLHDLGLGEIKFLTVGNPLNKFISGGQRKRLNIALELLREPSILFVDEPTSGLSSNDAEMVMLLLKEQTLKGKLVITNIHQPSSDVFKLFDKLWVMDKGGYIIYSGNPIDAVVYFKSMSHHVNADESECPTCGNVNPEQVLQIVEARVLDEFGKYTLQRKVSPKQWHNLYVEKIESKYVEKESQNTLPKVFFRIPDSFEQFKIFSIRNLLSKFTNRQYMLINFLESPILALILGYLTKFISGTPDNPDAYLFSENENIPAFLFMAVVVSLFVGLTVSAEEIIRDRKILERESFLNLSRFSYLNSKILILFAISAIQTFSFVLIGHYVLEFKGMLFNHWLILFATSCLANMVGLNLSAGLNSVVTIYISIPFILVPQLLLSGTIVSFDKLHKSLKTEDYVPLVGDMMTTRWAFEALAVTQFKDNAYERNFFEIERQMSNAAYNFSFLIPALNSKLDESVNNLKQTQKRNEVIENLSVLQNEIRHLQEDAKLQPFGEINNLTINKFNDSIAEETRGYLEYLKVHFNEQHQLSSRRKDKVFNALVKIHGEEGVYNLKLLHYNKALASMVTNEKDFKKSVETNHRIVQKKDPIFKTPESNFGRAQFFASVKKVNGKYVDTFWFNITTIWLSAFMLYIFLIFDILRKVITFFEGIKIRRMVKRQMI